MKNQKDFKHLTHYSNGNLEEYIGKDIVELLFDVDRKLYHYIDEYVDNYDVEDRFDYIYLKNPFQLTKFENEFFLHCIANEMTPSEFIEDFNNNESVKISDLMETISVILYKSENFFNNIK